MDSDSDTDRDERGGGQLPSSREIDADLHAVEAAVEAAEMEELRELQSSWGGETRPPDGLSGEGLLNSKEAYIWG